MADDIAELEEALIGLRARLRSLEDMVFNHISLDASSDYPHPSQRVNALQFAPGLRLDSSLAYPPNGHVLTADNTKKSGLKWAPSGGVTDGNKGDITVSGGGSTWNINASAVGTNEIANGAVTFTKIQNIASQRLLGRYSSGNGVVEEIEIGSGLDLSNGVLSATPVGNTRSFWDVVLESIQTNTDLLG